MRSLRLQENGEVWVSWFVGYFIRIISSVGYHPKYSERWGVLQRPLTGLFIINGGRNSYDRVEIAKKLRKLNKTNILVGINNHSS